METNYPTLVSVCLYFYVFWCVSEEEGLNKRAEVNVTVKDSTAL